VPQPLQLNRAGAFSARFVQAQKVGVYNQPVPKGLIRIYGQGDWDFITCSCYHRQPLMSSASRRDLFLQVLEETRKKYQFIVAGYVVMPEHFHLLIGEPKTKNPSVVKQVDFNVVTKKEVYPEVKLHSLQSCKKRIGEFTRTVALEQFQILFVWRGRTGQNWGVIASHPFLAQP
jgi:hypothetical protein